MGVRTYYVLMPYSTRGKSQGNIYWCAMQHQVDSTGTRPFNRVLSAPNLIVPDNCCRRYCSGDSHALPWLSRDAPEVTQRTSAQNTRMAEWLTWLGLQCKITKKSRFMLTRLRVTTQSMGRVTMHVSHRPTGLACIWHMYAGTPPCRGLPKRTAVTCLTESGERMSANSETCWASL